MVSTVALGRGAEAPCAGGYRRQRTGEKHFLAIEEGVGVDPELAVRDSALGFWAVLAEVNPETRLTVALDDIDYCLGIKHTNS